jgi:hypothetical protein
MTRADVTRLAQQNGYKASDSGWLSRSATAGATRSEELVMIDLTFREGRLVAVREGAYDPRKKRTEYRQVDLCKR